MSDTKIEQSAKVYLLFDAKTGKWVIDPLMLQGDACDGMDHPHIEWGEETDADAQIISDDVYIAAEMADLPTPRELTAMLAIELGMVLAHPRDVCRNAVPCTLCRAPMGMECRPYCPNRRNK